MTAPITAPKMMQVPVCWDLPLGQRFPPASGCATPLSPWDRSVPKHLLMKSQKHPPSKFLDKINCENVTTAWGSHQITLGGKKSGHAQTPLVPASSSCSQTEQRQRHPLSQGIHPTHLRSIFVSSHGKLCRQ